MIVWLSKKKNVEVVFQQYMSAKETKLSRFTEGRMSLLEIGRNLDKSQIDFEKKLSSF